MSNDLHAHAHLNPTHLSRTTVRHVIVHRSAHKSLRCRRRCPRPWCACSSGASGPTTTDAQERVCISTAGHSEEICVQIDERSHVKLLF